MSLFKTENSCVNLNFALWSSRRICTNAFRVHLFWCFWN